VQKIMDKLDEVIERFESKAPVGTRFHTPNRQDFVELAQCVKELIYLLQKDGEEID
jgi:hypothetical protein